MRKSKTASRPSSLRHALDNALEAARKPDRGGSGYHVKLSRAAMGCLFEIFLHPEDRKLLPEVIAALDAVEALEQQMSVYREDSELTLLNRTAALHPVVVEPGLYGLLRLASHIGLTTDGAYDITTGSLIRSWGFLHRSGKVPLEEELAAARACSGWRHVEFDDVARTVFFRRPGVELNLGSIGKGFALDCLAERLSGAGLRNFMAHAGHSSIVARGDSSRQGWEVGLRGAAEFRRSIVLVNEAMSSSGTGQQYFEEGGRRYGHILDPRTGWPVDRRALCSVIARRAVVAEALSTALFVMSMDEIRARYEQNRDVCIILNGFSESESAAPVVLGKDIRWAEEASP